MDLIMYSLLKNGITGAEYQDRALRPESDSSFSERRATDSGRLGRRKSDLWMPYSAPFVVQLLNQCGE